MVIKETARIPQRSINLFVLFFGVVWVHALFAEFLPLPNSGVTLAVKAVVSLILYVAILILYSERLFNQIECLFNQLYWESNREITSALWTAIFGIIIIVFGYFSFLTVSVKTIPYFETMLIGQSGEVTYTIRSKRYGKSSDKFWRKWVCPKNKFGFGGLPYFSICNIAPREYHKLNRGDKLIIRGKIGIYGIIPKYYFIPGTGKWYLVQ